jgi:hypothetical protein
VDSQSELTDQRDSLVRRTDSLRLEEAKLEHEVLLAPVRTRIALLSQKVRSNPALVCRIAPSDESILSLSEFAVAHKNDPQVNDLFQRLFSEAKGNTTKAAIALFCLDRQGKLSGGTRSRD